MRLASILLVLLILVCLLPLAAAFGSGWIAAAHGCVLHEGHANPCLIDGRDWGEALYAGFVSGWFMLVTLPLAALALVALIGLALTALARRRTP
jgi:hypothetical protein